MFPLKQRSLIGILVPPNTIPIKDCLDKGGTTHFIGFGVLGFRVSGLSGVLESRAGV